MIGAVVLQDLDFFARSDDFVVGQPLSPVTRRRQPAFSVGQLCKLQRRLNRRSSKRSAQ
jgi:hypothetical protein